MAAIPQSHLGGTSDRVSSQGLVFPDFVLWGGEVREIWGSEVLSLSAHHFNPPQGLGILAAGSRSLHGGGQLGERVHTLGKQTPRFGSLTGLSVLALKTHTQNTMTSESGRNLGQGKCDFLKEPLHLPKTKKTENKNLRGKNIEWKHFTLQREHRADNEDK